MTGKQPEIIAEQVKCDLLPFVRRPSRYIGGEINQVKKDFAQCQVTVALCFPDVYEIGMSHTGLAILYDILNKIDCVAAERVFCPWTDAEEVMRAKNIPLFSLESKAAVKSFDIVGFSLSNELCYTNMLNMLDIAGLNVRGKDRNESDPFIIAGGQMANCCEPIADFIDLFVLGEAEEAVIELTEVIKKAKKDKIKKKETLLKIAEKFDWAYIPTLYDSKLKIQNSKLKNAIAEDFDNAPVPVSPIVPFTQAVHERVSVEVMRGCPGRCRFCQASFCRRPIRYRSVDRIVEIAKTAQKATGFDTVSLLSLSTADYPQLEELVAKLHNYFRDKHVGLSLPSLRVDKHLKLLPEFVNSVRKSGLTIAVEAAGEKLRQIINKPLKDEDLFAAVEATYKAGWQRLKLYFMVGLPGETEDDIKNIVNLSAKLARLRRQIDGKTAQINVAISWFVPKPHTPFGWLGQMSEDYFVNAKKIILEEKRKLGARSLQFKFHNIERSTLESAIGRSDRSMGRVIETAWRNGAKFDLWGECFDIELWRKAFEQVGFELDEYAQRKFDDSEDLPWEHLGGPDKQYLLDHLNKTREQL